LEIEGAELEGRLLVHWFAMLAEVKLHNDDPGLGLNTDYSQRARVTKRGRISEEFKYEMTVAKIQRGETSSARVGVRSSGSGVSTSAGMAWEEAFILGQNAADLHAFSNPIHVRVAEDASRAGTPAEDTMLYFCWEASTDLASVWAPQVSNPSKRAPTRVDQIVGQTACSSKCSKSN
jgi:hypothetical protein